MRAAQSLVPQAPVRVAIDQGNWLTVEPLMVGSAAGQNEWRREMPRHRIVVEGLLPRDFSDALDDDRRRHTAGGAHRDEAELLVLPLELV